MGHGRGTLHISKKGKGEGEGEGWLEGGRRFFRTLGFLYGFRDLK